MTKLINLWEFPGGIYPPENKRQSLQLPLAQLPIPPQLIIPLNQHIGAPAKPIVKIGERVLTGQLIAAADGTFSANIHASSSGVISAIGSFPFPHPSGMNADAIVIDTDGKHEWVRLTPCDNYLAQDQAALLEKIGSAGVTGLGGAGFPTVVKLSTASTQKIDTLVINGAECEPYITADDMLMQMHADDIIAGAYLLSHILQYPQRILIGVEDNKPKAISALQAAIKNVNGIKSAQDAIIEVVSVPTKYPSGGAKQLIQLLTGRETPNGRHSADIGTICVNVGTLAAAWRAVYFGEPLISRITTIVGEALTTQRNIHALLGTPIDYALAQHGFDSHKAHRVIMGGSMMGFTLPNLHAPIIKTTNCIIAASKQELPPPPPAQACIRCGLCAEACPASLLPQQLFWYAQAQDLERLQAHHIFDCIECGACSYVCPSKIPLVQYYRAGKGEIRQQHIEKEKADRSRQRFEFRKTRFAKEAAEKEAKRAARKKAAEEAKQLLAAKAALDAQTLATHPVAQAVATLSAVPLPPNEQKAKLERMVAAAKNSLASAKAPLVPRNIEIPITDEQRIKQQARIKQAELKLSEAEKKLAEFTTTTNVVSATTENPVNMAIARAQEKMAQAPEEKLRANLEALQMRLVKMQEKADQAKAENSSTVAVLQQGVEKMQQKIAEVNTELTELLQHQPSTTTLAAAEQSAAERAIANASAKAAARASMSHQEKHTEEINAIKLRLEKAKQRLLKAEAENDANLDIFKLAITRLEEKLVEKLEETTPINITQ